MCGTGPAPVASSPVAVTSKSVVTSTLRPTVGLLSVSYSFCYRFSVGDPSASPSPWPAIGADLGPATDGGVMPVATVGGAIPCLPLLLLSAVAVQADI